MAKVTPLKLKAKPAETTGVVIKPPNLAVATVAIKGTAPLLQNNFSSANREGMMAKQKEGSQQAKKRRAKPPKDFEAVYTSSMHIAEDGWYGVPADAFRKAMIEACRLTEIDMVRAKMCIRIIPDGKEKMNGRGLVRIIGEPVMHIDPVKIGINQTDLAARALFDPWGVNLTIEWDADVFSAQDIINLLARAGWQVGVGAGRPLSKMSAGIGMGTFEVMQ